MNTDTRHISPFGPGVDSYNRMETVLANRRKIESTEWLIELGQAWSSCDNVGLHREPLQHLLSRLNRAELDLLMTPGEIEEHRALPDRFQIFRGCYEENSRGLSWSLNRTIAMRFPKLRRYRMSGTPLLFTGWAYRDQVVLKLDRDEKEVIAFNVFDVSSEVIL